MTEVEKESYNVSSTQPDKIVVNGVDLVNRAQLSTSQNRELQRYIDNHAHLLGLYDKSKDEKEPQPEGAYYGGRYDTSLQRSGNKQYDDLDKHNTQSFNRIGSPSSDYGTAKGRKGVSFADDGRARSHSPSHGRSSGYGSGLNSRDGTYDSRRGTGFGQSPGSTSDRRPASARGSGGGRNRYDQSIRSRTESPNTAPFKWKPYQSYDPDDERRTVAPPYPAWLKDRRLTSSYSSLSKHPDNYNRYDTEKYMSRLSRNSREKDEEIKFSSYGDRLGSGIELSRKRWTGGEIITDPFYMKKSLKPRTMFYSPIGDGVVAADGVELKKGPPDLTPRVHVTHERVVEYGRGKPGRRVYEHTWDTGGGGGRSDNEDDGGDRGWPFDDEKDRGWPQDDGKGRGDLGPKFDDDLGLGDSYPRATPLSFGGGPPREGWTKCFIVNPRELINQFGTETLTTIFDLKDHTPKTLTTIKETMSPVEAGVQ